MEIAKLNLRHLRAFVETVALESLSKAAQAVNLTQPAITQALAKLETLLGLPLFDRHANGMTPLPPALLFTPRAQAALAHINSQRVTMTQVQALITLAKHGSYAAASAATQLSQPALHRAIQDATLALGRTLVERRGRGVMLTEAGQRAARGFRLACAELTAGLSEIEELKGREVGRIAIGAMPLARARLLPTAVAAFHRAHPEVDIMIAEGSHTELIEPLRDGELDMLIGALRDPPPGDDVIQRPLFEDHPVILGRKDHPLINPDIAALADYSWIITGPATPLRVQWERMFTAKGIKPPHVPIACGSVITIRQLLMTGDYLTMLSPDQVAVELEAGWLRVICDTPEDLVRTIGLTTRSGWNPTKLQATFVNHLLNS